ncbi:MAG: NBR1-Ig-like domain-containing protein [Anaerolineales bacterium]
MKYRSTLASTILILALIIAFIPVSASTLDSPVAAFGCNRAQFIADVTIPDGTTIAPGATFTKTWRLRNIGNCTWTTSYTLVFSSGTAMTSQTAVNFPSNVGPGQTVDLSVPLTAPTASGQYIGYWQLRDASGNLFGLGWNANKSFWVEINVSSSTSSVGYDFAANACQASWTTADGALPCPGTDGSPNGFVLPVTNPQLEDGSTSSGPGLITQPENVYNGEIQGTYPAFLVQNGDHFQSVVNCAYNATGCSVTFRLDYQIGNGPIYTFWSFREKYDGLYYQANVDLSPLAGQNVKFILTVLAFGPPSGDRALWSNPIIQRNGGAPVPTATVGPGTPTPVLAPPPDCDRARFIADVTVPDGTVINAGATFAKTWRLKNVGSCTWTTAYSLIFDTGDQMGGPSSVNLPQSVAPGQTTDLTITLTAPSTPGEYRGYWKFEDNNNIPFGLGWSGTKSWWVDIIVSGTAMTTATPIVGTPGTPIATTTATTAGMVYDFAANVCYATWFSGAGALPCPGTDGDPKGFVLEVANPTLENGTLDQGAVGLITYPQNTFNGYIQGFYPSYTVRAGDRFRSIVNCSYNDPSCYVVFRLDYQTGSNPIQTLWAFAEKYDGLYGQADVDLSPLVGQNVKFILTVLSAGSPIGDRALWVSPMIYNASALSANPTSTLASTPVVTATPVTGTPQAGNNTLTYVNQTYHFQFSYPSQGQISNQTTTGAHITLPFTSGANLVEKYLDVSVATNATTCSSPLTQGYTPGSFQSQQVSMNGVNFVEESGSSAGAGNVYNWVAYSTLKGTNCISLGFTLHSTNPGNYPTPPPTFNMTAESAVFSTIVSSFAFTQ